MKPPIDQFVRVTLTNGAVYRARWDGIRWWLRDECRNCDLPVESIFVAAWQELAGRKSSVLAGVIQKLCRRLNEVK